MIAAISRTKRCALAALVVAAVPAFASPPAPANPPSLQSASAGGGLARASWALPPNVSSQLFEVAKYPDVNVFGYFRQKLVRPGDPLDGEDSLVRFGTLDAGQTSLKETAPCQLPGVPPTGVNSPEYRCDAWPPLPAGVYYVHIGGHDNIHTGCPAVEFSDIFQITVDGSGTAAPTSQAVAPGTGGCTLVRSTGGGGSAGGGGGPIAGDKTAPVSQLRYRKRQDIDKLFVRGRMSEPGTLTAKALVDVGGLLAKIYTFRPATRKVSGGLLAKLPLKVSKKKKRALKRAMRRGKRLRARITVTARDKAGNTTTKHAVIRLKR